MIHITGQQIKTTHEAEPNTNALSGDFTGVVFNALEYINQQPGGPAQTVLIKAGDYTSQDADIVTSGIQTAFVTSGIQTAFVASGGKARIQKSGSVEFNS